MRAGVGRVSAVGYLRISKHFTLKPEEGVYVLAWGARFGLICGDPDHRIFRVESFIFNNLVHTCGKPPKRKTINFLVNVLASVPKLRECPDGAGTLLPRDAPARSMNQFAWADCAGGHIGCWAFPPVPIVRDE